MFITYYAFRHIKVLLGRNFPSSLLDQLPSKENTIFLSKWQHVVLQNFLKVTKENEFHSIAEHVQPKCLKGEEYKHLFFYFYNNFIENYADNNKSTWQITNCQDTYFSAQKRSMVQEE